jgi:basic membrane lipoprotein Med (substrate-binding protein (PBP1-ABC) superfamily)
VLRVGAVGPVGTDVTGVAVVPGTLESVAEHQLVLVAASAASLPSVAAVADAHPASHFAYVGGSTKGHRRDNLVGLVLDDEAASMLGGVVAGLVAGDQGGLDARVAWVGPEERALSDAYARGAQDVRPGTTVLRASARDAAATCKEAALGAIARGAVVVMAHEGICADAAVAGAHQQNRVGLRVSDFELTGLPVSIVVRDAVSGVYRGGEDLVFGAATGAVGIRRLDPRISPETVVRARAAAQQLASGQRPSG